MVLGNCLKLTEILSLIQKELNLILHEAAKVNFGLFFWKKHMRKLMDASKTLLEVTQEMPFAILQVVPANISNTLK